MIIHEDVAPGFYNVVTRIMSSGNKFRVEVVQSGPDLLVKYPLGESNETLINLNDFHCDFIETA